MFSTAALLIGAALIALSLWLRLRTRQCVDWPSVLGRVIESRVDDANLEMMKPVLRYSYEVSGRAYVGFRASFTGYGSSRAAMEQVVKPYAQGSIVKVFYNPRDPASAVLNNKASSDWLYWFLFGLGFVLLAAYLAWR